MAITCGKAFQVQVGTFAFSELLGIAIRASGRVMDERTRNILKEFPLSSEPRNVDLFVLRVRDLGFRGYASYQKISERISDTRLSFCSTDAVFSLCRSYHDQPRKEILYAAMPFIRVPPKDQPEAPPDRNGIFVISRNIYGIRLVVCLDLRADSLFGPDDLFAFMSRFN